MANECSKERQFLFRRIPYLDLATDSGVKQCEGGGEGAATHIRGTDVSASCLLRAESRVFDRHGDLGHLARLRVCWTHTGRGTLQARAAAMDLVSGHGGVFCMGVSP
jgi:hypothetical protein